MRVLPLNLACLLCVAAAGVTEPALAANLIVVPAPGAGLADRAEARAGAGVTLVERSRAGFDLVRPRAGTVTGDALAALRADPAVATAEIDRPVGAADADPLFGLQWYLRNTGTWGDDNTSLAGADIGAPAAWAGARGAGVAVAVADTGVDFTHPDLAGRVTGGWDYVDGDGEPDDENGHGTHVTGLLAAVAGNGIGITGVAPEATVRPLRILDGQGQGLTSDAVSALADSGAAGVRIVVAAFGAASYSPAEAAAIAANPQTLYVAAAGNGGADVDSQPVYPCALDLANVICVGASDAFDRPAPFSNRGARNVDLFAPGDRVVSTWPGDDYAEDSGTSMAAPLVAGAAALVLSAHPQLSAADVKRAILETAAPRDDLTGLAVTGGRLDVAAALVRAGEIEESSRTLIASRPAEVPSLPAPVTGPVPPAAVLVRAPAARVIRLRVRRAGVIRPGRRAPRLQFWLSAAAPVSITVRRRVCGRRGCSWRRCSRIARSGAGGVNEVTLGGGVSRPGRWQVTVATADSRRTGGFTLRAPVRRMSARRGHSR